MLFNKDNKGNEELKSLIGWIYKSNNFANIETDIKLAEEEIIKLIGKDVYDRADNYYNGSGSGSGSGSSDTLNDQLVEHIQLPVALIAYESFMRNADVSHEDTGRKVKIDAENEKLPWEWMLVRDEEAILEKANKMIDRLIAFLEENEDDIPEWKDSTQQATAREMFLQNAEQFDEYFPINKSRAFYLRILPFMKQVENTRIKPALTSSLFNELKTAIKDNNVSSDQEDLLILIRTAIAPLVMAKAVKLLSLEVLPNGVIQNWVSDRATMKAKGIAPNEMILMVANALTDDGEKALLHLQEYLRKKDAEELGEDYEPQSAMPDNDSSQKFFRT